MDKAKTQKVLNVAINTVLIIFLAICIFTVAITLLSSRDADGAANIFGHQLRLVTTSSMDKSEYTDTSDFKIKSIPAGSLILIEKAPEDPDELLDWYRDIKVDDVLTFRYLKGSGQVTITHRVIDIKEENGGFKIDLQGDNKSSEDGVDTQHIDTTDVSSFSYVIGKVKGQSVIIGNIVAGLKTVWGVILMVILPCVIIIALEAHKIWKTLQEEKKEKAKAVMDDKNREIEELKLQLEQMKASMVQKEVKAEEAKTDQTAKVSEAADDTEKNEVSEQDNSESPAKVEDIPESVDEKNEEPVNIEGQIEDNSESCAVEEPAEACEVEEKQTEGEEEAE